MSATPISKDIALRIALAAREIPDTSPARLLKVLADAVGLPPTKGKLAKLKVKELQAADDGEFADVEVGILKSALAYLKGEVGPGSEPLPEVQPYTDGEMPDSVRVACASTKGDLLDGHFGSCKRFLIYQVSSDETRLVDIREIDDEAAADDKNAYRAALIADSQILFIASIGGPAAAKVVRAGVHPIKKPETVPSPQAVAELQAVIGKDAPPWLAKVMGQTPEERIRFEQSSLDDLNAEAKA